MTPDAGRPRAQASLPSLRALWLGILLLFAARPVEAQVVQEDGIYVAWEYAWPSAMCKGWFPLRFDVRNSTDRPRELDIRLQNGWQGAAIVTKRVELGPNARERIEVLVPAFSLNASNRSYLRMRLNFDNGERANENGLGPTEWIDQRQSVVLWVSDDVASEGELEQLRNQTSWFPTQNPGRRSAQAATDNNVLFHHVTQGELSRRARAYTCFDAVCIDGTTPLSSDELDAMLAYARAGGTVGFFGRGARKLAPEEWVEPRFLLDEAAEDGEGPKLYRYGHGLLLVSDDEIGSEVSTGSVREALQAVTAWTPSLGGSRSRDLGIPDVPGVGALPFRALTLLLVLFAVLIGPVNFVVIKRLRRPWWLLWTIPTISLFVSGLIVAFGIFNQGLDIKSATRTIAVLDQRTRQATTVELRSFFAGTTPKGMKLEPGSTCFPELVSDRRNFLRDLLIDATDGEVLTGAFAPARTQTSQVLTTDRISRLRLGFTHEGAGLKVLNGLDTDLKDLFVRTAEGKVLRLRPGGLTSGGEGQLMPIGSGSDRVPFEDLEETRLLQWLEQELEPLVLVPSSYLAVVEDSPFVDDGGLELNVIKAEHVIFGILPAEEEEWR